MTMLGVYTDNSGELCRDICTVDMFMLCFDIWQFYDNKDLVYLSVIGPYLAFGMG